MFGSTLALAGAHAAGTICLAPCLGCIEDTRTLHARWVSQQSAAIIDDLYGLYETPMSMAQMRSLFRLYPQLDCTSPAFEQGIHDNSGRRTRAQKNASAMRHKGSLL